MKYERTFDWLTALRWLAGLMTHQHKKLPVTMKMWMQFNVMPRTSLGVDAVVLIWQWTLFNNIYNNRYCWNTVLRININNVIIIRIYFENRKQNKIFHFRNKNSIFKILSCTTLVSNYVRQTSLCLSWGCKLNSSFEVFSVFISFLF